MGTGQLTVAGKSNVCMFGNNREGSGASLSGDGLQIALSEHADPAGQHHEVWVEDIEEVCYPRAERPRSLVDCGEGDPVSRRCGLGDGLARNRLTVLAETSFLTLTDELGGTPTQCCARCKGVETSMVAGYTPVTAPVNRRVPKLSGGVASSAIELAIDDEGTADAGANRQQDHVQARW